MNLKLIETKKAPAAVGPYSQGVQVGSLIFTSGQLPIDPKSGELVTDIGEATRQSLENVKAILEEAGSSMEKVIKVTVFVADLNNFGIINDVYSEFFSSHRPSRSLVEVSKLPKGGVIEIEVIAAL